MNERNNNNDWDNDGYDIPDTECGKYEVSFNGKVTIDAFDSGDAISDVTEKLRNEGFLVESVSAYKP